MEGNNGKIIILKADAPTTDPFKIVQRSDYTGYESLKNVVGGLIEHFHNDDVVIPTGKISIDFWCNEEFLFDESITKINALASSICGQLIYGDVAVTIYEGEGESRGFAYMENPDGEEDLCECWFMEDIFMRMANNKDIVKRSEELHKKYDDKKPNPKYDFLILPSDKNIEKE